MTEDEARHWLDVVESFMAEHPEPWLTASATAYALAAHGNETGWWELSDRLWDAVGTGGPTPSTFAEWVVPLASGRARGRAAR